MRKWLFRIAAVLAVCWLAFVTFLYSAMRKPPEQFTQTMARLPMPAMMLAPFPLLWANARAGTLDVGAPAPDFELFAADGATRVRLSEHRGVRPVALVFGSYT